ncbi:MAG: peptidyl-tRNA hydrolase Pth2 [Candidatus Woesearchaeota archaeon]
MGKEWKQVILVRMDLKMPKGKLAAQVGHASVGAMLESPKDVVKEWLGSGGKKVVLKVKDEAELLSFEKLARREKLKTALIQDAGHTVLEPGTITCLGIGPDAEEKIDKVTGRLKML